MTMASVNCPECDASVEIERDTLAGEIVTCQDCSAELEVTSLEPLSVELAPEMEEDWGE